MLQTHEDTSTALARKLLDAFGQFRRLHGRDRPIPDLTPGEMMLLFSIKNGQEEDPAGFKVSEIGTLLRVSGPTVTQQVNSLVARGWVAKTPDQEDKRVVRITCTARGDAVMHKAFENMLTSFRGVVEYLGEEDSNKLAELLLKMVAYFDAQRQANAGVQE